jgi:hypothetical protein
MNRTTITGTQYTNLGAPSRRCRPPPHGGGVTIGICLGVGAGLPPGSPVPGISIGVVSALALETAFRNQRKHGGP